MTEEEKIKRIRELNDQLRTTGLGNGRAVAVASLAQADPDLISKVVTAMREFTDFNEGDDPYGEHDFGAFTVDNERFIFKIDYFALDELHGSEHPEDPTVTIRVCTLLYASDY
jgi:hypothetical protein